MSKKVVSKKRAFVVFVSFMLDNAKEKLKNWKRKISKEPRKMVFWGSCQGKRTLL